jgi:glutathione S-transferase
MMMIMGKTDEEKVEGQKQLFAAAETLEGALKESSKGKPFFGGDSVGYVDIALGGFVAWVQMRDLLSGLKHIFQRRQDPAPGGVAGALRRIERNPGSHAGRDEAGRTLQEEASPGCCCGCRRGPR